MNDLKDMKQDYANSFPEFEAKLKKGVKKLGLDYRNNKIASPQEQRKCLSELANSKNKGPDALSL